MPIRQDAWARFGNVKQCKDVKQCKVAGSAWRRDLSPTDQRACLRGIVPGEDFKLSSERRTMQHVEKCFNTGQIRCALPHDHVIPRAVDGNEVESEGLRCTSRGHADIGFAREYTVRSGEMAERGMIVAQHFGLG